MTINQRSRVWRWLIGGPDPVGPRRRLPWLARWLIVVVAVVVAWLARDVGIGQHFAWGLQYGALVLVAIVASFWWYAFLVNLTLALLWFLPLRPREQAPERWKLLQVIVFVNRQAGHYEALLVWVIIGLASWPRLPWQIGALLGVLLLGPPVVNGLARRSLGRTGSPRHDGDLLWRRRVLIYALTLLGLGALCLRAPGQAHKLLPMVGAFFFGGVVPRFIRHRLRERGDDPTRAEFRAEQALWARRLDLALPIALVVGVGLLAPWGEGHESVEPQSCARDPGGPLSADVGIFLLADSQTHDLGGSRFPGQLPLADSFVQSASRPVELNMLVEAPMAHFAAVYRTLAAARPGLWWAHLGDLADLPCRGELDRVQAMLAPFAEAGRAAGVAFGNHEMSFTGSFHWSPFWDRSCPSGRIEKDAATEALAQRLSGGAFARLPASFFAPRGGALVMVTPLGVTRGRGVIGVFLDSTDGRAFDYGMPGSIGAISGDQLERAGALIAQSRGGAYARPLFVLFSHHPYSDLAAPSQRRLAAFVAALDRGEPRVLALVAAHKHAASVHDRCLGGRPVREIVIGSTIDPPQQAALLEIGPDAGDRPSLRVRTLQAVDRGRSCGAEPAVSDCLQLSQELLAAPACQPLLGGDPRSCGALERRRSLGERLRTLGAADSPAQSRRADEAQARNLLACVCRAGDCLVPERPLDGEAYANILHTVLGRPSRVPELVCLAWAAGARQAHKAAAMTMGEALRCAFDDTTSPAAREMVSDLGGGACTPSGTETPMREALLGAGNGLKPYALLLLVYAALFLLMRRGQGPLPLNYRRAYRVLFLGWAPTIFVGNWLCHRAGVMSFLPWVNNALHTFVWIGLCLGYLYWWARERPAWERFLLFAIFSFIVKHAEQQLLGTWEHGSFFGFGDNTAYLIGWSLMDGLYPFISAAALRLLRATPPPTS